MAGSPGRHGHSAASALGASRTSPHTPFQVAPTAHAAPRTYDGRAARLPVPRPSPKRMCDARSNRAARFHDLDHTTGASPMSIFGSILDKILHHASPGSAQAASPSATAQPTQQGGGGAGTQQSQSAGAAPSQQTGSAGAAQPRLQS